MKISNSKMSRQTYSEGTTNLIGSMGLIYGGISKTSDIGWSNIKIDKLQETPLKILLHYRTEPPKINFVEVTSFLNGYIYGIDVNKKKEHKEIFSIKRYKDGPEISKPNKGETKVFDVSEIIIQTKQYLKDNPIPEGEMIIEAHSEYYHPTKPENKHTKSRRIYAALAIGKPRDKNQNYLLMEDSGFVPEGKTDRNILEGLAMSVIGCEEIENTHPISLNRNTHYDEIYIASVFGDIPEYEKGWAQIQLIYVKPPNEIMEKIK